MTGMRLSKREREMIRRKAEILAAQAPKVKRAWWQRYFERHLTALAIACKRLDREVS